MCVCARVLCVCCVCVTAVVVSDQEIKKNPVFSSTELSSFISILYNFCISWMSGDIATRCSMAVCFVYDVRDRLFNLHHLFMSHAFTCIACRIFLGKMIARFYGERAAWIYFLGCTFCGFRDRVLAEVSLGDAHFKSLKFKSNVFRCFLNSRIELLGYPV